VPWQSNRLIYHNNNVFNNFAPIRSAQNYQRKVEKNIPNNKQDRIKGEANPDQDRQVQMFQNFFSLIVIDSPGNK
jgi:hypothetical protein